MSATPMQVLSRPFAIEPVTSMMLPDGIFDNAIYELQIACHYTNQSSATLRNVTIYLESVGDPGIAPVARTHYFAEIPPGASVLVKWDANFKNATPGKRLISFVAQADGHASRRSIQQIFVSQTRYDPASNTYTCTVEEGTLTVSKIKAIVQRPTWVRKNDGRCECPPEGGPWIPTGMTLHWAPNPAFAGVHGELPFADPWWKILAWIVAVIAAIVAVVAASKGAGMAVFGVGGTFDETEPSIDCCTPHPGAGPERDFTVAGAASVVATVAAAVGMSDAADPFWRGQEHTPPPAGEITVAEEVVASWSLPDAPRAGKAYTVDVEWTYTRYTSGKTYTYSVAETQTNIHVLDGIEIETPATVRPIDPLWVRARFRRDANVLFKGPELYALALFRSPGGLYFVVPLTDDGLHFDPGANDGTYAGFLHLEHAYKRLLKYKLEVYGTWRIYLFAQDVNLTKPGTPPEIAAQHIGGFLVASAVEITFDSSLPCPMTAQASVTVA